MTQSPSSASEPHRRHIDQLPALTSIRFFAACHVVLMHYCQRLGNPANIGFAVPQAETLASVGYLVLQMFFVLSGFVLAWNYAMPDGQMKGTSRDFWTARVARIYPAYLFSLLIALPVFLNAVSQGQSPSPAAPPLNNPAIVGGTVISTPLLIQGWFGLISWNPVGWSLSAEAFFYASFPFVLKRVCRLSIKGLLIAAVAAYAISMLPAIVCVLVSSVPIAAAPWYPMNMHSMFEGALYCSPLLRFPEFFVGVALGRVARLVRQTGWRMPAWSDAAITVAIVPMVLATAGLPGPIMSRLFLPYFGLLVYSLAEQRGPVARILSHPKLEYLGQISFSIYLLHDAILYGFFHLVRQFNAGWILGWPSFVAMVVVVSLAASAAYKYIEVPGRPWVRRLLNRAAEPVLSPARP